jgi:hypothetical protein
VGAVGAGGGAGIGGVGEGGIGGVGEGGIGVAEGVGVLVAAGGAGVAGGAGGAVLVGVSVGAGGFVDGAITVKGFDSFRPALLIITRVCDLEVGRTGLTVREAEPAGLPCVATTLDSTDHADYLPRFPTSCDRAQQPSLVQTDDGDMRRLRILASIIGFARLRRRARCRRLAGRAGLVGNEGHVTAHADELRVCCELYLLHEIAARAINHRNATVCTIGDDEKGAVGRNANLHDRRRRERYYAYFPLGRVNRMIHAARFLEPMAGAGRCVA